MEPDKGKLKEGIAFISKKKDGYLRGVLHRDDIGDIDLPWGVAHNDHTGKGMAHIIRKHIDKYGDFANVDEAAEIISDVVENGKLREDGNNTVAIEKDNYRVVVVKDNEGNWILSAFDFVTPKKEKLKRKDAAALDTPGQPVEEAGAVTPNLSAAKVAKADETAKDSGGKVAENGEAVPTEGERVVGSAVLEIARESTDVVADKAEMQRALDEQADEIQKAAVEVADRRFNEQLDKFKNKEQNGLMNMGRPQAKLLAAGVNDVELTLAPDVLNRHLGKHNLTTDDLKGLAAAIQDPILVYRHGEKIPNIVVVTELSVNGKKLSIAVKLDDDGKVVEINNVSSVHAKDALTELERLSELDPEYLKNNLRWVEKEKVSDWFSTAGLIRLIQENSNPKLVSTAKVVENFENPKISADILQKMMYEERYRGKSIKEKSEMQLEKCKSLLDALHKAGFPDFYISRSITDFGASTYIQGSLGLKFRLSDHDVTNFNRIFNEEHISLDTSEDFVVGLAKSRREELKRKKEIRDAEDAERREKERLLDEKWDRIKSNFNGYVFKSNDVGTYNNYEKQLNDKREYLLQKSFYHNGWEQNNKWRYEWAEKKEKPTKYDITKPSYEWLEAYDEDSNKIRTTQFLKTRGGEVYGFVKDGKMYVDPDLINPETPIHEYGHLWDEALRANNGELWARWKELVRGSELWQEVVNDANYADIRDNEDLVASEVKSRLTGKGGAERFQSLVDEAQAKGGVLGAAEKVGFVTRVKNMLKTMWEATKQWFADSNVFVDKFTKGQIRSMSVEDFVNKTLNDFAEGVDVAQYRDGAAGESEARFSVKGGDIEKDRSSERGRAQSQTATSSEDLNQPGTVRLSRNAVAQEDLSAKLMQNVEKSYDKCKKLLVGSKLADKARIAKICNLGELHNQKWLYLPKSGKISSIWANKGVFNTNCSSDLNYRNKLQFP